MYFYFTVYENKNGLILNKLFNSMSLCIDLYFKLYIAVVQEMIMQPTRNS